MLKGFISRSSTAIACLLIPGSSRGFDPFSIAKGAEAASSILGGARALSESADIGFAFTELLSDLEIEPESDQESEALVQRLKGLQQKHLDTQSVMNDAGSAFNVKAISTMSYSNKIRHLREMIKLTRKVSSLLGLKPKAASNAIQVQQTRLSYMMLDELMAMRRANLEQILKSEEDKAQYQMALAKLMKEEKAKLGMKREGKRPL